MGIIKAVTNAISGGLADSWGEVIEPAPMGESDCMVPGVRISNDKSQNTKGTANIVSNGSVIHVYNNQGMLLIDGGKIVDFTAEPGYYQVSNSSMPSLFCGQFGDTLKETFSRVKYGGVPSQKQMVFFINLAEIRGIKFGVPNPVQYFDNFYNSELFIRAHGTYSIKVTNFLKFYEEVIPKDYVMRGEAVNFQAISRQYDDEFNTALSSAINQYSADGNRVSYISSKGMLLGEYMSNVLDEAWEQNRGMNIQSVGINISYDADSQELIKMRNKGAMLSDAAVQQGYVAGNIAEGLKAAGSNANGAMAGFMGMGMGMNAGGNILGGYQQNPQYYSQQPMQQQPMQQQPMQQQPMQQQAPQAVVGAVATTNAPAEAGGWTCACGAVNNGKFCSECGTKKPEAPQKRFCTNCGKELVEGQKFCSECGTKA